MKTHTNFLLILPKSCSAVMKEFPKTAHSHISGFLKASANSLKKIVIKLTSSAAFEH